MFRKTLLSCWKLRAQTAGIVLFLLFILNSNGDLPK